MQTPHGDDWSVSTLLWWPDFVSGKRSWYIVIICLLRQLVPVQLFWRWDEALGVTARPAVSLEVSPFKPLRKGWVDLGSQVLRQQTCCTSSVEHARFWGPSYSCFQLNTSVCPLWTHVLTQLTQILLSCCLHGEKEPPSDHKESGWVLLFTDCLGQSCTQ